MQLICMNQFKRGDILNKYFEANAVLSIFSKNYMKLKDGLPIRPSEMGVLNIITQTPGPHTPVMLADLLSVSKPMITAHITALESKGYIMKEPSSQDRRAYYIIPTDKAWELVACSNADLSEKLDCLVNGLGQEGFDTLVALAEKANHIMKANRGEKK